MEIVLTSSSAVSKGIQANATWGLLVEILKVFWALCWVYIWKWVSLGFPLHDLPYILYPLTNRHYFRLFYLWTITTSTNAPSTIPTKTDQTKHQYQSWWDRNDHNDGDTDTTGCGELGVGSNAGGKGGGIEVGWGVGVTAAFYARGLIEGDLLVLQACCVQAVFV